jgi:hypothetical protein
MRVTLKGSDVGYVVVVVASFVVVLLASAVSSAAGNVVHVRHDREPNAGSSLFPAIPFVPALLVGLAWLLDQWHDTFGSWAVITVLVFFVPLQVRALRMLESQLHSLAASNVSKVPDESPTVE